jgi:ABC-2 type transport system permease protein
MTRPAVPPPRRIASATTGGIWDTSPIATTAEMRALSILVGAPKGNPNGVQQWWALTTRLVRVMARGELYAAVVMPLVFTVALYFPLHHIMQSANTLGGLSYAQYVMPLIVLQTMAFTMVSNSQLAAWEAGRGFISRLQTMPVAQVAPFAARIAAGVVRSIVSLAATIAFGYMIGFRFLAGFDQAVLFCIFTLAVGTTLAVGADALGSLTKSPEALSQALTLPVLIFGMLSVGLTSDKQFPRPIRGFVRNQPISQFTYVLRDLTTHTGVSWHVLWVPLTWLIGMAGSFIAAAIWAGGRR